jgi:hypothetical protein
VRAVGQPPDPSAGAIPARPIAAAPVSEQKAPTSVSKASAVALTHRIESTEEHAAPWLAELFNDPDHRCGCKASKPELSTKARRWIL